MSDVATRCPPGEVAAHTERALFALAQAGTRYFWSTREVKVLEEHYPAGGVEACRPHLPRRTGSAIHGKARDLRLKAPRQAPGRRKRWTASDAIDDVIRRAYQAKPTRGFTGRLAQLVGRPKWWVVKRAAALGLSHGRVKEPEWSDAEVELLHKHGAKQPDAIARIFRTKGYARSTFAVINKLKRLGVDRTDDDHFTARALADVMGVDGSTVSSWIERRGLKARRRGTERVASQGGDQWWIHVRDFRRWVIENPIAIDLRKVTDSEWFIDLLANGGGQ